MSPQDLGPNEDGGRGFCDGGWRLVGPSLLPGLHITPWVPPTPKFYIVFVKLGFGHFYNLI